MLTAPCSLFQSRGFIDDDLNYIQLNWFANSSSCKMKVIERKRQIERKREREKHHQQILQLMAFIDMSFLVELLLNCCF